MREPGFPTSNAINCVQWWLFVLLIFMESLSQDRCLSFCPFFWPLSCLSFLDLRILMTPLVFSNSSYWYLYIWHIKIKIDSLPKSLFNNKKEIIIMVGRCLNPTFFHKLQARLKQIVCRCQTLSGFAPAYTFFSQ